MESLTRLVSESFARHGFDRPLDYRRLHWSRWFPCETPRSLLLVPSKPGVFALAEEIMDLGASKAFVGTAAAVAPLARSAPEPVWDRVSTCPEQGRGDPLGPSKARLDLQPNREERDLSRAERGSLDWAALAAQGSLSSDSIGGAHPRRMLAVLQFCEDDDMAFVLDRMFSRQNPMRARLASGRCFVRFVVLQDQTQRRNICNALNQWLISSSEVTTGIGAHFASSLELTDSSAARDTNVGRTLLSPTASTTDNHVATGTSPAPRSEAGGSASDLGFPASTSTPAAPQLDSGAAKNIHCPSPFPSGF